MSRTSSTLKRLGVGSVGVCTLLATPYLGGVANAAAPVAGTTASISIASQTTNTGSTRNDGANSAVKISATTTPPGAGAAAINGVRFSYQVGAGTPVVIRTDATAPYSIEWAPPAAGTYNEIAEALDSANNVISASTKTGVVVGDVSSVRIATPAEGATVGSYGGNIVVSGTRSADLPAISVRAQTRDNSSGTLTGPGAAATGTAGTGGAWSATVAAPPCVNSVTAGDCNVVISAVATGTGAGNASDEVTEAKLYAQTLTTFNVDPTSATKPVGVSQDYLVTAQDQNSKPIVGLPVAVTPSGTASATPATGTTGPDGTFTFAGANSAIETATFTVQSKWSGGVYNPAVDFSRTATLTTYASTPTKLSLSADPAKSLYASQSEYTATTAGALGTPVVNLCIVDQNGNGTPNSTPPPTNLVTTVTRTTTTNGTTADPVTTTVLPVRDTRPGKTNCYVIPKDAASGDSGQDVFNAYYENNGFPGYQAGSSDFTVGALTLKFATLVITTNATQAQQGTNASVAFKVAGLDGTPFAGRKIALAITTGAPDATFPTTQPAGTSYTGAASATCLTDANGVCNVTVSDPTASGDEVTATDSVTDAALKQVTTPASATSYVEFRTQSVALARAQQDYWATKLITPSSWAYLRNGARPMPGDAFEIVYNLLDTAGLPLAGVSTTVTLDHGFFTPQCTSNDYRTCTSSPAIADGAQAGNLKNEGRTKTVTSDDNGQIRVTVGIARDAGFDDDGRVDLSATLASSNGTVVNGPANPNSSYYFSFFTTNGDVSGRDPINGASVKIVANSSTDKLSGDVQVQDGTRFHVEATDQFGNLVRTRGCDITVTASGNGQINSGWPCSNGTTLGSYTNNRHTVTLGGSTAGTFAGEPSTVTATWPAPVTTFKANTPATTPPTYTVNNASVNKTDSFTVNLYAIDQQNLQYTFKSTPGNSVLVNTAVTTSVTIKDQKGNPVRNALCIRFIRSGPDAQSGDTGDCSFGTNSEGRAGYSFSSTSPGTATLSVIVTDGNGNELGRGVQNVTFNKATPPASKPTFSLATNVISAGQSDRLVVRGTPGQTVQVLAYSLPSTTYKVVRTGTLSSAGTKVFDVAPGTNSRIYVRSAAGQAASQHITVKAALTLAASAKGRVATFTGKVSPAVVGRTVTIYYVKGGKAVAAGSAKVVKGGTYTFSRTFAAPGQKISFFAQTTKDSLNASGRSLTRQITFGR